MSVFWPSGEDARMESATSLLIEAFDQGHRQDMAILELLDRTADTIGNLLTRIVELEAQVAGLEAREQARQDKALVADAGRKAK